MGWAVESYQTEGGSDVLDEFVDGLDREAQAEAIALLQLVEARGNRIRLPHSRSLGKGLNELRGKKSGVRMFYAFRPGQRVVVLGGIVKKQARIPAAVLARMRDRLTDVRKNE
ncbi:MAG: type II toxin-antitoxin system RelE/ParE family toxin [Acidobacteria bacterium]|nr:type II toxin-antitoxin system RelE/ParE family toxin [Acidobacteriota bacterium]MCY4025131.1 type II toxin-antitoxin system RelE/ParE family toxin [Acidobacteriota bacterium]